MPPVGFEPTISVLERAKTVRVLDRTEPNMYEFKHIFFTLKCVYQFVVICEYIIDVLDEFRFIKFRSVLAAKYRRRLHSVLNGRSKLMFI
jgi:hypothetical protein